MLPLLGRWKLAWYAYNSFQQACYIKILLWNNFHRTNELVSKSDIDKYMFISIDIDKSYRFMTHKNKKANQINMLFNFLCISFVLFFTSTCLSCILTEEIQIQHVTFLSGVSSRNYSNTRIIISTSRKRPVLTYLLVPGSQSFLIPGSQSFLVHGCQSFLVHDSQSFLGPGSQNFLQLDCLFLHDHRSH